MDLIGSVLIFDIQTFINKLKEVSHLLNLLNYFTKLKDEVHPTLFLKLTYSVMQK